MYFNIHMDVGLVHVRKRWIWNRIIYEVDPPGLVIEAQWQHMASGILLNIGSVNNLSPVRRQAITRTIGKLFSIGNKSKWNWSENTKLFFQENVF